MKGKSKKRIMKTLRNTIQKTMKKCIIRRSNRHFSQNPARFTFLVITCIILIVGCDKDKDSVSPGPKSPGSKALSFYEEKLAGKWSRYHAYDRSTDYFVFKSDRTGCEWTEPNGGGKKSENKFTYWELDEKNPVATNVFRIVYTYAGSSSPYTSGDEFHYLTNEIWLGGYDNLINKPSTTSKDCD
jgi:hypothetical protein